MPVYLVSGRLGNGKTLAAVGKMKEYAQRGMRIAGNIDIYLEHLSTHKNSKCTYTRVPDRPTAHDLIMLGQGNETYDEENNGLLVLDEIATWLNARSWNAKGRAELIDWFVHARKYGWDIIFLVQFDEMMDTQIREALAEYKVKVIRLDRIKMPFMGFTKHLNPKGKALTMPKIHWATVYYEGIKADRWIYKAKELYKVYNTKQVITDDWPHATFTQLSQWHLVGRYLPKPHFLIRYLKIILTTLFIPFLISMFYFFAIPTYKTLKPEQIKPSDITVTGVMQNENDYYITISTGQLYKADSLIFEDKRTLYKVDKTWYAQSL